MECGLSKKLRLQVLDKYDPPNLEGRSTNQTFLPLMLWLIWLPLTQDCQDNRQRGGCKSINRLIILIRKGSLKGMFLSDFFFFCQSTATVLILRYCLMNTAIKNGVFFLCSQPESNQQQTLRRGPLYPFNYESQSSHP